MIGEQGKVMMKGNKVDTAAATREEKNGDLLLEAASDISRCKGNFPDFLLLKFILVCDRNPFILVPDS